MRGTTNSQRGTGGGGEKLVISLKTNQASPEDLIGAKFSVVISGNATEYTWQGTSITIPIPSMLNYTVEFGEVEGYAKPESVTHTAVAGNDRFVTGTYNTELVTVNVSADKGTVSGYEVTIAKVNNYGSNNEYTEVEYIEATGSQYIDTGFIPNQDTRIVVKMEDVVVSGVNDFYFGARTSATSNAFFFSYSSDGSYRSGYNKTNSAVSSSYTQSGVFTVDKNKGVTYINGTQVSSVTYASFTCPANLVIGGINTKGTISYATAKYYACQIYDNGTLIRDYVPVVNKSGIAGLYDKVNNAFYSSASSTAFEAGGKFGDVISIQTTSSATYKLAHGVEFAVKGNDVFGYAVPDAQYFITSQFSRNINYVYKYSPIGVFIQGKSKSLYSVSEWSSQETPNGIAVCTENCKFIIAPKDFTTYYVWTNNYITQDEPYYNTIELAKNDFNGYGNTSVAINKGGSNMLAATAARNYKFPNGEAGYIGSAGEWQAVFDNLNEINTAFSKINISLSIQYTSFWSSTSYSSSRVYKVYWRRSGSESPSIGNGGADYMGDQNIVHPFGQLIL